MAATLGHQINNPLGSLVMAVNNLQEDLKNSKSKHEDDLFIINQSIERISKFVEALKNLKDPSFTEYALNNQMLKID